MLRGAGQPTSLADTLDTTSGASTADTATPAEATSTSLEDASASAGAPQPKEASSGKKNRVSLMDDADTKIPIKERDEGRILDKQTSEVRETTTNHKASVRKSLTHLSALQLPGAGSSAREVVDFYYRKAEQKHIWDEMQNLASSRVEKGHQTHLEDDEHRAAVLEHVPDENLLGLLDDETPASGKPNSEQEKSEGAKAVSVQDAKAGNSDAANAATGSGAGPTSPSAENAASKSGTKSANDAKSAPKGKSPLKELICAKKVDLDQNSSHDHTAARCSSVAGDGHGPWSTVSTEADRVRRRHE
jgi:hypothetical protein